jgi:predicted transcriptional regulator
MTLELKPEQQEVLERAARAGMSQDDVLDQAFAVIREQFLSEDWMLAEREAVAAHVAEGFAQAERGELLDSDEAVRSLKARRSQRIA